MAGVVQPPLIGVDKRTLPRSRSSDHLVYPGLIVAFII